MGLDMYLHAKKYVEKVNWQALQDNDELSYDSPEVVFPLWNNIVETAGMKDVAVDIYGVHVEVTCAYWRKANQIHKWFVDNVQGGEDNCGEYYVSHEKLKDLLDLVNRALAERNPNLLPPQEGIGQSILPTRNVQIVLLLHFLMVEGRGDLILSVPHDRL